MIEQVQTTTGTTGTTIVFPESLQCRNGGCYQQAIANGRCIRHDAMWELYRAYTADVDPDKGLVDLDMADLLLQHFLFCEGFPEFKDF